MILGTVPQNLYPDVEIVYLCVKKSMKSRGIIKSIYVYINIYTYQKKKTWTSVEKQAEIRQKK